MCDNYQITDFLIQSDIVKYCEIMPRMQSRYRNNCGIFIDIWSQNYRNTENYLEIPVGENGTNRISKKSRNYLNHSSGEESESYRSLKGT